jgi:Right handed beta helix region
VIEGPGLVQRFRRHGIALFGPPGFVDKAVVKKLVSHQNCYSGVWLNGVRESLVEEVVAVKNSAASRQLPCGGVCITNSHNNRIRRSEFAGNGSTFPGAVAGFPSAVPNDFGAGLVGNSSGNIIEENGIGGNINGIMVHPTGAGTPTANLIRKNVVAGNPPIQISANPGVSPSPDPVGSDIRDFGAASCSLDTTSECPPAANRFHENLCLTYTGPNPLVCLRPGVGVAGMVPRLPQFAGHQNN